MRKKTSKETPSINLNALADIGKEENETPTEVQVTYDNVPFDEEQLQRVWDEFIKIRTEMAVSDIELIILKKPWKLLENNEVELYLNSHLEVPRMEKVEKELVQYVRKQLNNGQFKVKAVVKEAELKDQLYTDRDKYDFMIKKNPHLKDLKDELGLDFEF